MRLAFVSETYPPEVNGVALTVRSLVECLRGRGHRVEVVRPWQPVDGARAGANEGGIGDGGELLVASHAVPRYPGMRFGWPAGSQLRRRWRSNPPDAIYVATEGPLGFSALRAARSLGIPVLTGFHTRFDEYLDHYGAGLLKPVAAWWLRRFHNRAQATLVPTSALQAELVERRIENVMLLRRGIDTARFSPERRSEQLRAAWGLQPQQLAVLHVGRLAAEKNLDLLLAAYKAIRRRHEDARLVLVGEGPALAALTRDLPDAIFCGVRTGVDLAAHYASGDLFVFPSLSETYGNVTLEALSSGVPVVAFAQGAAIDFLKSGVNGAAIAPDDAQAFVQACIALADEVASRPDLRRNARDAVAHLSPEQVAVDFELLATQIVHACGGTVQPAATLDTPAVGRAR